MLTVPKTSTTVWVLILLFETPTATTTLLITLATLTSLLAALILTLILCHHYLPIWVFPKDPTAQVSNTFYLLWGHERRFQHSGWTSAFTPTANERGDT